MNASIQVAALWQRLTQTKPLPVLIGLLMLLILLVLVGVGVSHALQGAGLMAPGPVTTPPPV